MPSSVARSAAAYPPLPPPRIDEVKGLLGHRQHILSCAAGQDGGQGCRAPPRHPCEGAEPPDRPYPWPITRACRRSQNAPQRGLEVDQRAHSDARRPLRDAVGLRRCSRRPRCRGAPTGSGSSPSRPASARTHLRKAPASSIPPAGLPGLALAMSATSRVEQRAQLGGQGQVPERLAGARRAAASVRATSASVAHHGHVALAERDDVRPGEGRDVDDGVRLLLARGRRGRRRARAGPRRRCSAPRRCVPPRMRSTSLGRIGACRRHVLGDAEPRGQPDGQVQSAAARVTAITVAAPVMSYFMPDHDAAGLQRQPAGVEGDALADEREVLGAPSGE